MKFKKFVRTIPMKLYVLLAVVILFAFFSNDFGLVDIQKTAIILAAAIDKTEEGFSLTAQIAVPKGSDRTTGGTSSVEIEAEGKTVSDCITLIYTKTGWVPKLVFCNLILLGEDAAKADMMDSLNYFLRNEYMPDTCLLAVSEGKAGELLSSQSAIDDASSLAITKLFSDAAQKSGKVMPCSLKDFAIGVYGVSKSGYLPYVRSTPQQGEQGGDGSGSSGGSGGSGGSSGGGGGQEPQQIYSADQTAIFSDGKMVGLLPREQTFAFSLLKGKVFAGTFNAMDDGQPITLSIIKNNGGVKLEAKEGLTAKFSIDLLVRLCCRSTSVPVDDGLGDTVPEKILQSAKTTVEGYVEDLFENCKACGCDLFNLKQSLYRSSLKKYAKWKDNFLPSVSAETKVEMRTRK